MDIPEPDQGISSTRWLDFIAAAFPLRPLPQMSLHQAQLADPSMSREITDEEWRRAGELDRGRSWNEFSDDNLIACDAALSHLDEQSFSRQIGFLDSIFIEPYQTRLSWEYGNDEEFVIWVFGDLRERDVVAQYCLGGHGRRGSPCICEGATGPALDMA